MIKALLFDLDGTLANTDLIHFQTWQVVLQDYGLTLDRPFYDRMFTGRLNAAILRDVLPQLSSTAMSRLSQHKEAEFRRRAARQIKPLAGVLEILDWATYQGLRMAVVTNAPVKNAHFMLAVLRLADRFSTVVFGDTLPKGKPDPLPYQVALDRLGIKAHEAIAFEDSPSGVRSAVGAGIITVGIATTQPPAVLYELGAKLVVPDFTAPELRTILPITREVSPLAS